MHTPASYRDRAQWLIAARRGIGDADLIKSVADRDAVVQQINAQAKRRRYALKIQQKIDRALESYVRINYTEWAPDADDADREKCNKLVKGFIARARLLNAEILQLQNANDLAGAEQLLLNSDEDFLGIVELTDRSRAPADGIRKSAETRMEQLAKRLPVAPWIETVHGVGLPGLALIVAEAAAFDALSGRVVGLDGYPNPAKLWKRLGYAPYDGLAGSSWKRDKWRPRALTKEEWIEHPFSGERYAVCYVIGLWLVNHQWRAAKEDGEEGRPTGPYGEIYAKRRRHCDVTHPDWNDEHRRKDALRVAFKAFIVDLWKAWIDQCHSDDLGQPWHDAHGSGAEIAAAGHRAGDAQKKVASGGTHSDDLGQPWHDAQSTIAEIAAAGQSRDDAQESVAGGGTPSRVKRKKNPGHLSRDAQNEPAGIAAAGQISIDAQGTSAGGGRVIRRGSQISAKGSSS